MFVVVLAVPALIIVVLGYAVWEWAGGTALMSAEVAGWVTGSALLALVTRVTWTWLRRRGRG